MTKHEAVRETTNFVKAEAKSNGIDIDELLEEVEDRIEEDDNGR